MSRMKRVTAVWRTSRARPRPRSSRRPRAGCRCAQRRPSPPDRAHGWAGAARSATFPVSSLPVAVAASTRKDLDRRRSANAQPSAREVELKATTMSSSHCSRPDVHAAVLGPAAAPNVGAEFAGDEGGEPVAAALSLEARARKASRWHWRVRCRTVLGAMALRDRLGTEPGHPRVGCTQGARGRIARRTTRSGFRVDQREGDRVALPTAEGGGPRLGR